MEPQGINHFGTPNYSTLNGRITSRDLPIPCARASEQVSEKDPDSRDLGIVDDVPALIAAMCLEELDEILSYLDLTIPDIVLRVKRLRRMITLSKLAIKNPDSQSNNIPSKKLGFKADIINELSKVVSNNKDYLNSIDAAKKDYGYFAKLAREIIRQRQRRSRYFDLALFADPAWDMMLDLFAAHGENRRVSVTSLCIASGVPPTTALRWIGQMVDVGLFQRIEDQLDRRRAFVMLTEKCVHLLREYFTSIEKFRPSVI